MSRHGKTEEDIQEAKLLGLAVATDAPDFTPEETHQAAVRLAQEAGKASPIAA